jgi:hypothetical protein|eukprot:COSAG06_NODE_2303_length_7118_cov_4.980339_5_plen_173_part_00
MSELHPAIAPLVVRFPLAVITLFSCLLLFALTSLTVLISLSSLSRFGQVCACPDTAETGGALMLDPTGGPHWKLISTQCSYIIKLPAGAHRVRVLPATDDYGQRLLEVDFHKNQSPMGPEETKYCSGEDASVIQILPFAPVLGRLVRSGLCMTYIFLGIAISEWSPCLWVYL